VPCRYVCSGNRVRGCRVIDGLIGTGSVLDAIRIGVPVIVVPNPTLLNNHQVEFAEVMAGMDYVVHGHLE
jgi:beta-1,4-N-acetylglucosaminyltransferase